MAATVAAHTSAPIAADTTNATCRPTPAPRHARGAVTMAAVACAEAEDHVLCTNAASLGGGARGWFASAACGNTLAIFSAFDSC